MKIAVLALAAASLISSGPSTAQQVRRETMDICVRPDGDTAVQVCSVLPGRLARRSATCACPTGARTVSILVCPPGVQPPVASSELRQTRLAASADGSLIGDMHQNQEICATRR